MSFRWGFKAEAERISEEVRLELDLSPTEPLDPFDLARHLAIPVAGIRDIARVAGNSGFPFHFLRADPDSFSALTVFDGHRRIIVHNEAHAPTRQRSDVSHELGHCLLEHPPGPALIGSQRVWDGQLEREADWLGAAILVPRDGALSLLRAGLSTLDVAEQFQVSEELAQWRINGTGVLIQLDRLARYSRPKRYSRTA